MFRFLHKSLLTVLFAAFASQASAMFIQPDWYDPTAHGVGTNRYSYSFNDPVNLMDPGGNESIIVSGGKGEEHNYEEHFLENGLSRAIDRVEDDPNTTWAIHSGIGPNAYADELLDKYSRAAGQNGINVVVVGSTEELENYINTKSTTGGSNTARGTDLIDYFSYVGHGLQTGLAPEYNRLSGQTRLGDLLHPRNLSGSAFGSNAVVNLLATCNSGNGVNSPAQEFSRILSRGAEVYGTRSASVFGIFSGGQALTDFYTPGADTDLDLRTNRYMRPGSFFSTLVTQPGDPLYLSGTQ